MLLIMLNNFICTFAMLKIGKHISVFAKQL